MTSQADAHRASTDRGGAAPSWAEAERAAFVRTLHATDPAAPTLCEGWTVHRLVAHLVSREHRPAAALRDGTAAVGDEPSLNALLDGPDAPPYRDLVDRFAAGPPRWSPFSWAAETTNLIEYVVHHEDVRRGGPEPAEPRVLPTDMVRAVWERLGPMARLAHRSSPTGVVHVVPGGPRRTVRRRTDAVAVVGDPVELALYTLGRRDEAEVDLLGRPETVEAFRAAQR
ncbi:TIGR03085 family metal-binding protein [Georgenia deserti]|uniref:TIGR03085 family metal-binding protein n=1 Tax=Georgenia deserti TaxID=2093781 RepID=A0ABW4L4D0_9MICO